MNHLGLDVHTKATVWVLLDEAGNTLAKGSTPTTSSDLQAMIEKARSFGPLRAGQEVGGQSYFVNDVIRNTGTQISSFNAAHLRMIASSRKKTDRRDALWIAKALQTDMTPHKVYMPESAIRDLRSLLSLRASLLRTRRASWIRAQALARGQGEVIPPKVRTSEELRHALEHRPEGLNAALAISLDACVRIENAAAAEQRIVEVQLRERAAANESVKLLMTIPGVGFLTAVHLYALIGDVSRFPSARCLAAYVGLVPSVRQSGDAARMGHITREGSPAVRSILVQAASALITRSKSADAAPLREFANRIRTNRSRYKIAVVALARYMLRIAFYVLRDKTSYDASRLHKSQVKEDAVNA